MIPTPESHPKSNSQAPNWWQFAPAITHPFLPIERIEGQENLNPAWSGEVVEVEGQDIGTSYRCVFKYLTPHRLAIELACSLSACLLGNDVPRPCVVVARMTDLPGVPLHMGNQQEVVMFGSTWVRQDAFFEQLSHHEHEDALGQAVWGSFCNDATRASRGAALDELIANFDRHVRNLRFDGMRWWLIDHELGLMPTTGADIAAMPPNFIANRNIIANELLVRRRGDHEMPTAARLSADRLQSLQALSVKAKLWKHSDPRISELWTTTAALLELLCRRLPMLPFMIGERIDATTKTSLPWTPTNP